MLSGNASGNTNEVVGKMGMNIKGSFIADVFCCGAVRCHARGAGRIMPQYAARHKTRRSAAPRGTARAPQRSAPQFIRG